MSVFGRLKQFLSAVCADLTAEDCSFVENFLPDKGARKLFFSMSVIDMNHAVKTARTAKLLAEGVDVNKKLLIRAALLHDIGRVKGDMGLCGKIFAVLAEKFFLKYSLRAAKRYASDLQKSRCPRDNGFFAYRRWLYIYFYHAKIGAAKLNEAGLCAEAAVVAAHHDLPKANDAPELLLLRRADELN